MNTIVLGGSNSASLAKKIAKKNKYSYAQLISRNFPDGESYVRLPPVKGMRVVLVQSMHPKPNDAIIEAILTLRTAKELGAKKTVLVAPYLGYLRQDKRFKPGESISNHIIADLLRFIDKIITIDPHLHRIKSLSEIFKTKTTTLSANHVLAKWIKKHYRDAIIVGPDSESYQWAKAIGDEIHYAAVILKKKRYSSRTVRIKVTGAAQFKKRNVIIVDDIVSTGNTMLEPIKQLKKFGAKKVICICVHGLFVENALQRLRKIGAEVVSTNTIENKVSKIDVSGLIAESLK